MANQTTLVFLSLLTLTCALWEGDPCVLLDFNQGGGTCLNISKCESAIKLLQKGLRPQSCGFNKHTPVVCCPNSPTNENTSRSEESCRLHYNIKYKGVGIAFGKEAKAGEFPHMAAIGYGDNKNIKWLCGASLISDRFVLTAAHCLAHREFGDPKWVRLGELNFNQTDDNIELQTIDISLIYAHPDYKPPSHYNDIALLKLKKPAVFGYFVQPACIHNQKELPSGQLEATGWGATDFVANNSSHLLKVFLNVILHEKCAKTYDEVSRRRLSKGILDESQICAGDSSGKDTCQGDSGGPLHFFDRYSENVEGHFVIVGVTSFGQGCGVENTVGVYTRVSAFRSWIEDVVWPLN